MKRYIKIIIGSLFIMCLILGLGYLGLSVYYENGFSFQTYINGIYCTGKSVETVNQELNDAFSYDGLTVKMNNSCFYIDAEEISYTYDYREPLNHYLKQQNPYLWIENLIGSSKEYKLLPAVTYSEEKVEQILKEEVAKLELPKNPVVSIGVGEDGFFLKNEKENVLNETKLAELVKNALLEGVDAIEIAGTDAYYDMPYTQEEECLMTFYSALEEYQSRSAAYHFGDEIEKISSGDLAKTLSCYSYFKTVKSKLPDTYEKDFYEDDKLKVDKESAVKLLVEYLDPYNTYHNHTFTTHDGRVIKIKGGTYGNQININKEKKAFLEFLASDMQVFDREPEYIREVALKGKDDIGDTYIEVDIGQQRMFYYRDGELYLETDVVTGKNKATREEVCYVYSKQTNRILRGPGYASPVKYWMPVSGGIGIHDASWRSTYGGDIYIKDGSHGCINTPLEMVEKMYEVVEIGTPCILYYGNEEE